MASSAGRTAALLAEALGLAPEQWDRELPVPLRQGGVAPHTDLTVAGLPARGVKRLDVICPAFGGLPRDPGGDPGAEPGDLHGRRWRAV